MRIIVSANDDDAFQLYIAGEWDVKQQFFVRITYDKLKTSYYLKTFFLQLKPIMPKPDMREKVNYPKLFDWVEISTQTRWRSASD